MIFFPGIFRYAEIRDTKLAGKLKWFLIYSEKDDVGFPTIVYNMQFKQIYLNIFHLSIKSSMLAVMKCFLQRLGRVNIKMRN